MGYKHLNYTKAQIEQMKIYYPNQDWDMLFSIFPGYKKKQIQKIAFQFGIRSNNPTRIKDITGMIFGELTVVSYSHMTKAGAYWNCICSCGKKCIKLGSYLRAGEILSCGHLQKENHFKYYNKSNVGGYKDKTGNRYGYLVVRQMLPNYFGDGKNGCLCDCDCGNEIIVPTNRLTPSKYKKSCGNCPKYVIEERNKINRMKDAGENIYIIYKHTSPSGKHYIGMTKHSWAERADNGKGYITQKKFYNAINKYGWDNFTHEVLEENLTLEEAIEREQYYIQLFDSKIHGYNSSSGGLGARQCGRGILQLSEDGKILNIFMSETELAKLLKLKSHKMVAKWACSKGNILINGYYWMYIDQYSGELNYDDFIEINSQYLKFDPYQYGKDKLKEISQSNGKKTAEIKSKKVNQYSLDGKYIHTYDRISDTYDEYGTTVFAAVRNRIGTAYGFQWKYYEGSTNDIDPINVGKGKKIVKLDGNNKEIITIYDTMTEAWKTDKIKFHDLKQACENQTMHKNGYYYQYYIDYLKGEKSNVIC